MPDEAIDLLDEARQLLGEGSTERVRERLDAVRPEDLAEVFTRLEEEQALRLLTQMSPEHAAQVLTEAPTDVSRALVKELPDDLVALYLDVLPMDDALDLEEELDPERWEALLERIPREDAQEIRRLMSYPEDSVGRLMTERFLKVTPETSVKQLLDDVKKSAEEQYETVNDVYVLSEDGKLAGVFSLVKALRASKDSKSSDLMRTDVVSCRAFEPAEDAARTMARYGFYALPVLDIEGRMLGIFTGDDAQAVLREAETEDVLKLGAVSGDVEAYMSLSAWQLFKRRMPWLLILFVAETLTGSVLRHYVGKAEQAEPSTGAVVTVATLMVFVPLLIGAGGNTGSQVTTTITRALAVGEIRMRDALPVLKRELGTALLIGGVLGAVGFLRAIFGWHEGVPVSTVVGLSLIAIVIWSALIGSVLPIAAKRMGVDPAVMSAPFISTFVDATGLIIYFEIARSILHFA